MGALLKGIRAVRHLALVGLVVAVTACTSGSATEEATTAWAGIPLNEYQQESAADGEVSDAELRDAYQRASDCVAEDGWQVSVTDTADGGLDLSVASGPGDGSGAAGAKLEECYDSWVGPLDSIFRSTRIPQGAEREAEFDKWRECMTSNGASVDGVALGQSQEDAMAALEARNGIYPEWDESWASCVNDYYFVLWPEALGSAGT